ncbi:ATP-dependent RNA helicase DDX54 [Pontoporia blainvillei]|uniref:ATP-dependent RNA helicase DDX54 n=1 Tax=Pontoporia blainvillei TaxID=48723 RepID=A0ABX0S3T2_PONBL|nr:ATP-dependent RNA helicase DDX54 [Pontoporia blainvillei]
MSLELRGLCRVADNAQQQYVRSRPAPSPESIKRAKELDLLGLGLHPLFSESLRQAGGGWRQALWSPLRLHASLHTPTGSCFQEEELQQLRLVDSIRNYRSRATIFEINASSRDLSSQVMRAKRQKDRKCIASFRQKRQEGLAIPAPSLPAPQEEQPEKEEAAGDSVEQDLFTEVVGRKRQQPGPDRGAKRRREEARQRDQVFYIPYRPKDFDSERGLSIGGDGGVFEQQVAGAVLDLMGDEGQSLTKGQQQLKWDRKKKRFVGQSGQEDKKKIKTESGRYISSSYKRDLYPGAGWGAEGAEPSTFYIHIYCACQPRTPGAPTGRVRSELKTKQQILKQRCRAQKLRFLQRGGLKQLSARNRRRARELQQGAFGRGAHSKKGKMRKSL